MQPQPPASNDFALLDFQIKSLEKEMQQIRIELRQCVPASVNELQLQSIRSTVERIESSVKDAKDQVSGLNIQLSKQVKEQDMVQINVLKWAVGLVITVLIALLIAHLTHFV
jgi:septal ring factor EnvC (AmiA/AmiB activator)